jgi:AAA+ ATPase superfamily predicted ATPase
VSPFDYYYAAQFAPSWSREDRIRLYAAAGGIPDYLEEFNPTQSLRHELGRLAFSPAGRLFREAADLVRSEFNEPRTYESILRAVAQGAVTPSEIADRAGIGGANRVAPYLERLQGLGLVERRTPPQQSNVPRPRTSQYVIADHYLRFYYALVDPWRSAIQLGQGEAVLDELWDATFDAFVSRAFEDACRQYVQRLSGAGQVPPLSSVGFWWYPGGDLDVAGMSGRHLRVAGSAKWTREFVKPGDLDDLRRGVGVVAPGSRPTLMLFARSGFDRNLARDVQVRLVTLSDMFRRDLEYERV